MKADIPLCCGLISVSVFAASKNTFPCWPFVMNCFVPFMTYSSPSRIALVFMPATSLPPLGSVKAKPPRFLPVARSGSHRCFCSSVPYFDIANASIEWVPIGPVMDIHPFDSSSNTIENVSTSSPMPPYCSGTTIPNRPISAIWSTSSVGYVSSSSCWAAFGITSFCTKSLTTGMSWALISCISSSAINGSKRFG